MKKQVTFRDENKRVRSGKVIQVSKDYYQVRADRIHIWEKEEDLLFWVDQTEAL